MGKAGLKRWWVAVFLGAVACVDPVLPGTPPFCGDNFQQGDEECDLGAGNGDDRACTSTCRLAFCGDGLFLTGQEECDNGPLNADDGACTTNCSKAVCGDGFTFSQEEECDDGVGNADSAACTADCRVAFCGDGLVHAGVEECDDGDRNGPAADCSEACTLVRCGDGVLRPGVEECDDGNRFGGDGCSPYCRAPRTVTDPDLVLTIGATEVAGVSVAVDDADDDGRADILVGTFDTWSGPNRGIKQGAGAVHLISSPLDRGAEPEESDGQIRGEETGQGLGFVQVAGNLDGDGSNDLVISSSDEAFLVAGGAFSGERLISEVGRHVQPIGFRIGSALQEVLETSTGMAPWTWLSAFRTATSEASWMPERSTSSSDRSTCRPRFRWTLREPT